MKSEPIISVIVPIYNAKNYLRECLDSILSQSYNSLQIILVDDGSTDSSATICDEYKMKDDRIEIIHKKNGGVSSARNFGMKYASGSFISFVDADDWLEPFMYEKLVNQARTASADISCCRIYMNDNPPGEVFDDKYHLIDKKSFVLKCLSLDKDSLNAFLCNKLFSSTLRDDLLMNEDITMGEDMVACCNAIKNAETIVYTDLCCYHYRVNPAGAMMSFKASHVSNIDAHKQLLDALADYPDVCDFVYYRMSVTNLDLLYKANQCGYSDKKVIRRLQKSIRQRDLRKYFTITKGKYIRRVIITETYYTYMLVILLRHLKNGIGR